MNLASIKFRIETTTDGYVQLAPEELRQLIERSGVDDRRLHRALSVTEQFRAKSAAIRSKTAAELVRACEGNHGS